PMVCGKAQSGAGNRTACFLRRWRCYPFPSGLKGKRTPLRLTAPSLLPALLLFWMVQHGVGLQEAVLLIGIGLPMLGGPVPVILLALHLMRRSERGGDSRERAELRENVQRLGEEVERLGKDLTATRT